MYFYQMSMLEILRNSLLCFLFYDSTEFSIWKKKHMYKTLLSLQKKFMWRQNFLIFSLFIKRSGNRRNAPKLSYMYICTFEDINKQTLLQWQLTSYHNIIILSISPSPTSNSLCDLFEILNSGIVTSGINAYMHCIIVIHVLVCIFLNVGTPNHLYF